MSHSGDILALGQGGATEASFDTALWGYRRPHVDAYVAQAESMIAALEEEREQAYAQIRALTAQVKHLRTELERLARRPPVPDRVSFRHLGPYVEQILTMAEEQAELIRANAARDLE